MQHAAHEHMGTFLGHVGPGAAFVVWAVWTLRRLSAGTEGSDPVLTGLGARVVLVGGVVGALGELWWASWRLVDSSVINYQHATMYLGFSLAAALALAHRRGRVVAGAATAAVAAAFALTGLLFFYHGSHGPVSGQVHRLLAFLLFGAAGVSMAEARHRGRGGRPGRGLTLARAVLTLAVGLWLCVIAWMLYRAGYDPSSPTVVMRANLFFAWTVLGSGLAAWLLGALGPERGSGDAG